MAKAHVNMEENNVLLLEYYKGATVTRLELNTGLSPLNL